MEVVKFKELNSEKKELLKDFCESENPNKEKTLCEIFDNIITKQNIDGCYYVGVKVNDDLFISFTSEKDFKTFEKEYFS